VSSALILAAVDGSPASVAALRWALAEAHTHRSHLQVITVYAPDGTGESQARAEQDQAEVVERLLDEGTAKGMAAELATEVVAGDPVDVVTTWSAHVGLLFLGRHGTQSLQTRPRVKSAAHRAQDSRGCDPVSLSAMARLDKAA
jgi:nucleotide-binding universal stress UspA family protein